MPQKQLINKVSIIRSILICFLIPLLQLTGYGQSEESFVKWGNSTYVDLEIGQSTKYMDKTIKLISLDNNWCTVEVDDVRAKLIVARREIPSVINGVRIFISDNKNVEQLAIIQKYPQLHGAMKGDALICLSDPFVPLLDPSKFIFPVDRSDGYLWTKATNSHMWGYLRPARSHEGIDIDMNRARGRVIDAIVAIEDGVIRWKADGEAHETCLCIESNSNPGVYYIYQHLNRESVRLKSGDTVTRGQFLAYIWGDGRWGHLHFSVSTSDSVPEFNNRYVSVLNCFPQLYELWHGYLDIHTQVRSNGYFTFAKQYWLNGNEQFLNGYDDILGYGWDLGTWCTAYTVERSVLDEGQSPDQSAILRKTMHTNTRRPATNPNNYFDFEIAVPNGDYIINAKIGNNYGPTWQEVHFENIEAGVFDLPVPMVIWTGEKRVKVSDGRLTIRIAVKDNNTDAGCYELYFHLAS
jgi:murein DD-endopeptidase MepM/ murein hydrolase activator NlpD